jgi:AAA domain
MTLPPQNEVNDAYFRRSKSEADAMGGLPVVHDPLRKAPPRPRAAAEPVQELPRELELIELSPLLQLQLDKPRELIGELVREASLGMIHAPAGVGKTFFGLGMAVSLTHGVQFLGYPVTESFSALYCDGEMAAYDLRERLRLLSGALDRMWHPLYVVTPDLCARGVPKIDSDEGRDALIAQLEERPEIKLVIIDNLACLTRPDGDDSHGARSFTFVQDLMLECRRRQVACWIVHHSGKSGEQRGTSKRNDVLDVVVKLAPVISTEGRTEVSVTFEKGRHMSAAAKVDFTACLEPGPTEGLVWTRGGSQLPINERVRLMLLDGMPPGDIAAELKTARSFVYRIREQLVATGDLTKPKNGSRGDKSGDRVRNLHGLSPSPPPLGGDRGQTHVSDTPGDRGQFQGTDRGQRGHRHEY